MKIVCDSCRTKYSIADEKVAGKVFKIRCKKCQNIIVVRGNQPAMDDPGAPAESPADGYDGGESDAFNETPVWHLVIEREQVGPMTPSEVRDRFAAGDISEESFIWKEGFTDWVRLDSLDEFADISQATKVAPAGVAFGGMGEGADAGFSQPQENPEWEQPPAAAEQEAWAGGEYGGAAESGAWEGAPSGDPAPSGGYEAPEEPAPAPEPSGGLPAMAGRDRNRDLFATYAGEEAVSEPAPAASGIPGNAAVSFQPAAFNAPGAEAGMGGGAAPAEGQQVYPPEEEESPEVKMTGARNENSVLFSLSNLQALAMGGKKASPEAPMAAAAPMPASDGEGSGLIDIRAMAGGAPAASDSFGGGADDLGDLPLAAPVAAAPVLMPAMDDERPKWLVPLVVGMGAALVLMVGMVMFLVLRQPPVSQLAQAPITPAKDPTAGTATATPTEEKAAPAKAEKKAAEPAKAEEKAAEPAKAEEKAAEPAKAEPAKAKASTRSRRKRPSRSKASSDPLLGGGRSSSASSSPKKSSSRRKASSSKGKGSALDDLIDDAIKDKKPKRKTKTRAKKKAEPAPADSNLQENLSRSDIQKGMRGVKGQVQNCYDKYKVPGLASVQLTIGRNGRVGAAKVKGVFAGTPTGACVKAAAKSAKFPKFKGNPMTITYPFILR